MTDELVEGLKLLSEYRIADYELDVGEITVYIAKPLDFDDELTLELWSWEQVNRGTWVYKQ